MKKAIIFLIAFLMIFTSACGNLDKSSEEQGTKPETKKENDKVNSPNKDQETLKYDVSNTSNKFGSNDLIYFIMTDRFYDGDPENNNFSDVDKNDPRAYHGGDLEGVIQKLDYIKSLGTTTIWITPVVENEPKGYHGYWTKDFYSVDPHLGNMETLKKLVEEAHAKDMKVILDHVVNHTGYDTPWLKDESKKDWFNPRREITNWNDQDQVENGWLFGLPDLNQNNPEVKEYLFENTLWWIENTNIDGMRLDTVKHVPREFWNEYAYIIKEKYPDFYLLGEVWSDNQHYLESYHKTGIDGLTNYAIFEGIRDAFTRYGKTNTLVNALKREKYFSNPQYNGIFIDNHDNTRLASYTREFKDEYLQQALTFVMTYPSIPIIYYGTEIGMEGGEAPDNRRDMEWDKTEDSEMLNFYRKLVDIRNLNPAIQSGDFKLLDYDSQFISYMRATDDSSVVVIINTGNAEKDVTINITTDFNKYTDLLTGKEYTVDNQTLSIKLNPLQVLILESK